MISVGIFSLEDCKSKKDKEAVAACKAKNPEYKYVGTKLTKKGLKVWLMNPSEYSNYNGI